MGSGWGARIGKLMISGFKEYQRRPKKKQPRVAFFSKENLLGKSYCMWEELRTFEIEDEEEAIHLQICETDIGKFDSWAEQFKD